jgi:carboxyl-terminal processing protease
MKAIRLVLLCVLFALPFSCVHREDPTPDGSNETINSWILENLQFWYYWNASLPASPDKSQKPDLFFESILNSQDRFSWIQEKYQELLNSLQGVTKEPGFEYALYREAEGSNNVIAQILYIKPGSPAAATVLKRGDIISAIDGQTITTENYKTLIAKFSGSCTLTYRVMDLVNHQFSTDKTLSIIGMEYAENPNFMNKVFTFGDKKIGYYVYNFFATGSSSAGTQYSDEMDQIFASFKSQNITDLIIDLRYNSGGAESATRNLASLIGKDVNADKVFAKREYNAGVTDAIKKDPNLGESFLTVKFLSKTQNIGSKLTGARVHILTGSRSASASELLINGLRPYMDVFLIGNKTVGKNMGSISLYEENNPNNTWGMQPLVTKSFNSLNQSDYDTGFNPQIFEADNSLYLYPLGDTNERLLNLALKQITGLTEIGREATSPRWSEEIGHSLDAKPRSNRLIIEALPFKPNP